MNDLITTVGTVLFVLGLVICVFISLNSSFRLNRGKGPLSSKMFVKSVRLIAIFALFSGASFLTVILHRGKYTDWISIFVVAVICLGVYPFFMAGMYFWRTKPWVERQGRKR